MLKSSGKLILLVAVLGGIFWPGIERHWDLLSDPYFVPYDATQYIPAFFKYDPVDPIPTTYAKEYFLNALCPPVYRWLTAWGAQLGDVRQIQAIASYIAFLGFIFVVGRLGWSLGGYALSFAVSAISLNAWIFLGFGFVGGASRMFAYLIVAMILDAIVRRRPVLLSICTILGSLLYPIVGAMGGTLLVVWLLVLPMFRTEKLDHWPLGKRIILVALTGILATGALLPLISSGEEYGRRVVAADIADYPEAGPEGNYRVYDRLPYRLFGPELISYLVGPLYGHGDPIAPWANVRTNLSQEFLFVSFAAFLLIALFVIVRGSQLATNGNGARSTMRCILFFGTCTGLHVIAWLVQPYFYIPTRFFMFSLPFLISFFFPWSLWLLLKHSPRLKNYPASTSLVFLVTIAMFLGAYGGRGNVSMTDAFADERSRPLFDAIAKVPKDAVVAGWPLGPIRKMEYITRRNAFLVGDTHQVLHFSFMVNMRKRMDALFDAYLCVNSMPLYRLRDEFKVTHLIVDTRNFTDPDHALTYYAPWQRRIGLRLAEITGREFLLNKTLHDSTAVFYRNGLLLLDLSKLP